ncbi:hypothetical protein J3R83DRAFT_13341 [Lanmaoa asiatica]|nr:hypothetical protein J3R83DRAFT_13341 [Lanmaoa asiatica]
MPSTKRLKANQTHAAVEYLPTPVHRCLFISEILRLIFEFIRLWDEDSRTDEDIVDPDTNVHQTSDGRKTLASLVRTCRSFSVVALDVLWRVIDSLDPLLMICPNPETSMDEIDWSSFRKYAERVRSIQIRGRETRVSASVKQTFTTSLERYPRDNLLIFPNLTELDWRETAFLSLDDSGVPLFKHFAGPAVTTISLSFIRSKVPPASELAILSDLPNLCPNVTSFTAFFSCSWIYDPSQQVGEMASQWKKLRSLRSCAIPQYTMDKLASQCTLETLGIEITTSSPLYVGRVPDTVQELLLSPRDTSLGVLYLKNTHGSPTVCRLFIGMNHVDEAGDRSVVPTSSPPSRHISFATPYHSTEICLRQNTLVGAAKAQDTPHFSARPIFVVARAGHGPVLYLAIARCRVRKDRKVVVALAPHEDRNSKAAVGDQALSSGHHTRGDRRGDILSTLGDTPCSVRRDDFAPVIAHTISCSIW